MFITRATTTSLYTGIEFPILTILMMTYGKYNTMDKA